MSVLGRRLQLCVIWIETTRRDQRDKMDDDEAPPELVDVSEQPVAAPSTTIQDTPVQQRVPITLVTGMARVEKG